MDATCCLGATFLQTFGYPKAHYSGTEYMPKGLDTRRFPVPQWFIEAFNTDEMHKGKATAKKLADVIERTSRSK